MDLDEFLAATDCVPSEPKPPVQEERKPSRAELLSILVASTKTLTRALMMNSKLPTPPPSLSGEDSFIELSQDSLPSSPSPLTATHTPAEDSSCSITSHQPQLDFEQPEQNLQPQVQQQEKKIPKKRKPRTYKYNPKPLQQKLYRSFVPDDLKDQEYWERRQKNNQAAKKSREERRKKELEVVSRMRNLEQENRDLREQLNKIEARNVLLEAELTEIKRK